MDINKFKGEVSKLEQKAKDNPSGYKFKVLSMSVLGYLYIFTVFILLLGLIAGIIGVFLMVDSGSALFFKLMLPLLLLLWVGIQAVLRSLFIKIPKPYGIYLTSDMAPKLYSTVEELRQKMECPKIKQIVINDDFNAAVLQRPRLGSFGFYENYLIIGLPYMMAVSFNEFKAVLAHELGHISSSHGRFNGWIYRVRNTWYYIAEAMEKKDYRGSFIFNKFFNWYIPKLWAYTFVFIRNNEYEADRYSAEMTSSKTAASSLISAVIQSIRMNQHFWKEFYDRVNTDSTPPEGVYSELRTYFNSEMDDNNAKEMLESALKVKTGYDDTHPSLNDRLLALGENPVTFPHFEESAADFIFNDSLEKYEQVLSEKWKEGIVSAWKERHDYICKAKKELEELEEKSKKENLVVEEVYRRATIIELLDGNEAALPIYQSILEDNPDNLEIEYNIGRILIEKKSADGVKIIENVIKKDDGYSYNGNELLYNYFISEGKEVEADIYEQKIYEQRVMLNQARAERNNVRKTDSFVPHDLDEETVKRIRNQLANFKKISKAYIVKKQLKYFQSEPLYVIGISTKYFWLLQNYDYSQVVANGIEMPGETIVIVIRGDNRAIGQKIKRVENSKII